MTTFPRVYHALSLFYLVLLVLMLALETASTFYLDGLYSRAPWLSSIATVLAGILLYRCAFSRSSKTDPQPGHAVIQKALFSVGKGLILLSGLAIIGSFVVALAAFITSDTNGLPIGMGLGLGLLLYLPGTILVNIGSLASSRPMGEGGE